MTTCEEAGGSNGLDPMDSIDVEEGENVVLKCRFPAELSAQAKGSTLFWIRTNRRGHDNVAIGEVPYQASYKVNRHPTFSHIAQLFSKNMKAKQLLNMNECILG